VLHTEEIVVKPMSSKLRHIGLFSGNTILGDGAVVLIVDPNGIARRIGAQSGGESPVGDAPAGEAARRERTTLLVLRAAGILRAVPLSLVTRLEEVEAARFETSGGRTVLAYRDRLMPILPLGGAAIRASGMQILVIVADAEAALALAVDEIVDIVEEELDIELLAQAEPGVIGSAMLRGRATEIIDIAHYLQAAHAEWRSLRGSSTAKRPRTLLVEPSDFLREMLVPVLRALGLAVETATDADGAIARADAEPFDVVLMDCDRDPQAAYRLAAALRTGRGGAGRRLIGLSALALPHLMAGALEAGLDTVIGKFDRHALMAQLTECRQTMRQAA
jgi:two-component system chemotaxis sensor kinase CheA